MMWFIVNKEKIRAPWIEAQTNNNYSLKTKPNPDPVEVERGEEATLEQFSSSRGWFMKFKKSKISVRRVSEAASADLEATVQYPEDLARLLG